MIIDSSNLPVIGGFVLSVVIYAGLSIGAGQMIGQRIVERSGWPEACEAGIRANLQAQKQSPSAVPRTDCQSVLGGWHAELSRMCWEFGNPDLAGPGGGAARRAERRARDLANRRLDAAAEAAGRIALFLCGCGLPPGEMGGAWHLCRHGAACRLTLHREYAG